MWYQGRKVYTIQVPSSASPQRIWGWQNRKLQTALRLVHCRNRLRHGKFTECPSDQSLTGLLPSLREVVLFPPLRGCHSGIPDSDRRLTSEGGPPRLPPKAHIISAGAPSEISTRIKLAPGSSRSLGASFSPYVRRQGALPGRKEIPVASYPNRRV